MEISNDDNVDVDVRADDTCRSENVPGDNVIDVDVPRDHAGDGNLNAFEDVNNGENNSVSQANMAENSEAGPSAGDVGSSNSVNGDTYTSRAAKTDDSASNSRPTRRRSSPRAYNERPKCPKSALFTPSCSTSGRSVFEALSRVDIGAKDI